MSLICDLTAIPERVHQGDFVLQLTREGTAPQQMLRDYMVTPQLVDALDPPGDDELEIELFVVGDLAEVIGAEIHSPLCLTVGHPPRCAP